MIIGLVLPPNLAPIQVVIVPIYKNDEQLDAISIRVNELVKELKEKGVSVKFDNRDSYKPGWKFAQYELKGVPVTNCYWTKGFGKWHIRNSPKRYFRKRKYFSGKCC